MGEKMKKIKMKTKIMMIAAASMLVTATAFADDAFDALNKLAATPTAQITTANAASILDASLAVTNVSAIQRIADAKAMTFADIFAKAKGKLKFCNAMIYAASTLGSEAEQELVFQDFVDFWTTLDSEQQMKYSTTFVLWCQSNPQGKKCMSAQAIGTAVDKIKACGSVHKAQAIGCMLYAYGKSYWGGRLDELCEREFELVKAGVLSEDVKAYQALDFITYCYTTRRNDTTLMAQLLNNIKWYAQFGTKTVKCPFLAGVYQKYEPTLTTLRKQYLETIASNDFQLLTVALAQDQTDSNKKTTESIFSKLTKTDSKIDTAFYLSDNDKLIDVAMTIDDGVSAERLNKIIGVFASFDPDYRAADVAKALRVINKRYTLKLYDDRDTWEPILSKVRALIEIYNG